MKLPKPYPNKNKGLINVVIETPAGNRSKFDFDPATRMFKLKKVLPAGMKFPYDMGFIPGTRGEDGDPLDALVLMDSPGYPGCLVECRLIGVIKAEQTEKKGKKVRNDRFLAVPAELDDKDHIREITDVNKHELESIVSFFGNYNRYENKKFKVLALLGPEEARRIIKKYLAKNE